MTCDNVFNHIEATKPLGDGLCSLEAATQTWLLNAGFDPFHILFLTALTLALVIVLIKTTFKGHDLSIGSIWKIGAVIAGLIILGIL